MLQLGHLSFPHHRDPEDGEQHHKLFIHNSFNIVIECVQNEHHVKTSTGWYTILFIKHFATKEEKLNF